MTTVRHAALIALTLSTACAGGKQVDPPPGPPGPMGDPGAMGDPGTMGTAGQACWDLDGNHACDLATEDTNDDQVCDVGDCIGPQGAPGATGTAGQLGASGFGTGPVTVTTTTPFTIIPGLSVTITVPANAVVQISTDGAIATTATAVTGFSNVDIAIEVDGSLLANGGYRRVIAANTTGLTGVFAPWNLTDLATLPAGSHTITVVTAGTGQGSDATVSGSNTSVNQGSLSVVVLRL